MSLESSFEILGLSPTLDGAAIKKAYFAQLSKHPPHQDPVGFRRLRAAYEKLSRLDERAAEYLSSPFDAAAMLGELEARLGDDVQKMRAASESQAKQAQVATSFVEKLSGMSFSEALALESAPVSSS